MTIRADSFLGRAVLSTKSRPAVIRLKVSPRLASFMIAAGARPAPVKSIGMSESRTAERPTSIAAVFGMIFGSREQAEIYIKNPRLGIALAFAVSERTGTDLLRLHADELADYFNTASNQALAASRGLSESLDLVALARGLGRDPEFAQALAGVLTNASAFAGALTRCTNLASNLDLDRARAMILERFLALQDPRSDHFFIHHNMVRFGREYELGSERRWDALISGNNIAVAREIASQLTREVTEAHERLNDLSNDLNLARERAKLGVPAYSLASVIDSAIGRTGKVDLQPATDLADGMTAGLWLDMRAADLRAADLRTADLGEANLSGVIWSAKTKWPAGMLSAIRKRSSQIEPGLFKIDADQASDQEPV